MKILGIETSCDDTAAAVVEDGHKVLSNVVWTQQKVHQEFGGIVPELAARAHVRSINNVLQEALETSGVSWQDLDAVAVTNRRGLLRSLVVGVAAAKSIAMALNLPLIGVHHIEGHIYSALVQNPKINFPFVCLTVSGGHNLLVYVKSYQEYQLLGRTLDDAAGEAFDKVARLLGLGFPGGPAIDKLAKEGSSTTFNFPRPMLDQANFDFSFSGIKTSVLRQVNQLKEQSTDLPVANLAASFQAAVVETLVRKSLKAAQQKQVKTIAVCGGVSANSSLRQAFLNAGKQKSLQVIFPDFALCTDNAAMIASLGFYRYQQGKVSGLDLDAYAYAPLGE